MRTLIIFLITSIDSFTCPEIRFCCVFQSIFDSNPDQTSMDEDGLSRTVHPFLWTTDQNFKPLPSTVDLRPNERIRTTDHECGRR